MMGKKIRIRLRKVGSKKWLEEIGRRYVIIPSEFVNKYVSDLGCIGIAILTIVNACEGITSDEIAKKLGLDKGVVNYYLRKISEMFG